MNGREWEDEQLLFADDTALVANSSEKLKLIESFGRVSKKSKVKKKCWKE